MKMRALKIRSEYFKNSYRAVIGQFHPCNPTYEIVATNTIRKMMDFHVRIMAFIHFMHREVEDEISHK